MALRITKQGLEAIDVPGSHTRSPANRLPQADLSGGKKTRSEEASTGQGAVLHHAHMLQHYRNKETLQRQG
jgi:hypothetical protein